MFDAFVNVCCLENLALIHEFCITVQNITKNYRGQTCLHESFGCFSCDTDNKLSDEISGKFDLR